jgi:hypothetical protein
MDYDEKITGGWVQVAWAVIQMAQVLFTPGSPEVSKELYADENVKEISSSGNVSPDLAIAVAAGYNYSNTQNKNPTKDDVKQAASELAKQSKENPDEFKKNIEEVKTEMQKKGVNPQVPLTEQKSLIQNMAAQTGDVEKIHTSGLKIAEEGQAFGTKTLTNLTLMPLRVGKSVASFFGYKSQDEQIDADKQKWSKMGFEPAEVDYMLQLKASYPNASDNQIVQAAMKRRMVQQRKRAAGEDSISGMAIAKIVLLVIIMICIFASYAMDSNKLLGLAIILLFPLAGVFAYDYFANGKLV